MDCMDCLGISCTRQTTSRVQIRTRIGHIPTGGVEDRAPVRRLVSVRQHDDSKALRGARQGYAGSPAPLHVLDRAVDTLQEELKPRGLDFPSLDAPYDPANPAEAALASNAATKAAELIIAAASQLSVAVRPPVMSMMEITWIFYLPAVLQCLNHVHVVELLQDAGPSGMHVRAIAETAEIDDLKLGHCRRLCATFHIFREVSPDVFANNRISSVLGCGKSYREVVAKPQSKHNNTNGIAAYLELQTQLMLPTVSKLPEHFTDERTKMSRDPTLTLLSTVHGYEGDDMFAFLESPNNAQLREMLALSMQCSTLWEPPLALLEGFDWASIEKGSLVVDVGGGIGHMMMPLYERSEHLRFEVQDLNGPCEHGAKVWDANVAHNWPDGHLETLLRHLRDAARPTMRLLIVDHVLPYACAAPSAHDAIPGARLPVAPEPLLPNLGRANAYAYLLDVCVMSMANARERTLDEHAEVASRAR